MKAAFFFVLTLLFCYTLQAQNKSNPTSNETHTDRLEKWLNLSAGTNGNGFLATAAYEYNWGLGQKKNFRLGAGIRVSTFFGGDEFYRSAPPEFYNDDTKADSIYIVDNPQQNNIALYISATYRIKQKIEAGFNIDALGYSFGAEKQATYGQLQSNNLVHANGLSLLLIDANDRGMLNSQFWIGYNIDSHWMIRGGFSHLFTEYRTDRELQPGNDRFRGVNNIPFLSVRYSF